MAKNKHLTLDDRIRIAELLNEGSSFKAIANALGKNCTTISREIRSHITIRKAGAPGCSFNNCLHRFSCSVQFLCSQCSHRRFRSHCKQCKLCNFVCPKFQKDTCSFLTKPPYVCNGCYKRNRACTLEKHLYLPSLAQEQYKMTLSEARTGISLSEAEIAHLDRIISPLLKKNQSLHHICINHPDSIMVSENTLYRLVDYGLFQAKNIDLPRKVRYARRKRKKIYKVDKTCRIGRTYSDYLKYIEENPDLPITQMDSVEGIKGGKVLLTIHFVKAECMLAFLRDANDSQSVIDIFDRLYLELRPDIFMELMPILLGDNGSEFSNPSAIEFDAHNNRRTHVFYCDASAPYQKGSAERNHEFIRMFLPKGVSLDDYTQKDISLMMDHINSYRRASLGNKSPYEMMEFLYGRNILRHLDCHPVAADDVTLNPSVFRKGGETNA
ncbi:MAG: IS30 family transposase [Acetatifactor sp.]|nr:IS30 family transposase [Acetatifactor sp.]